jgi:hypothetical protein
MLRWWPLLAGVALVGVLITVGIDESTKAGFATRQGARPAEWAMLPFWALYLLSTHILAPWHAVRHLSARSARDVEAGRLVVYPWWSWLFLGPLSLGDMRAKVPTPVSAVLIWIVCVLCAWLLLILSIVTVTGLVGVAHK